MHDHAVVVQPIRQFGRVGRIATEDVTLQLILSKCIIPVLLYGLEACPLTKSQLSSMDFVINRFVYEVN